MQTMWANPPRRGLPRSDLSEMFPAGSDRHTSQKEGAQVMDHNGLLYLFDAANDRAFGLAFFILAFVIIGAVRLITKRLAVRRKARRIVRQRLHQLTG